MRTDACARDDRIRTNSHRLEVAAWPRSRTWNPLPAVPPIILSSLALTPGTRLGIYEVTAPIGEGGMGQVYRATDTTLGRQVAIKILPDAFASDPDRVTRFEREAKTLGSLNHPHIAAIYGFERSAGMHALVMELVEGEDLSQRIARGAIPLDEALPIAKQLAEALEAAHEQGIIHRDLKPANIKITPAGAVKVLDFGLAKAASGGPSGPDLTQSPTITNGGTQGGLILGTPAYMSPEQVRGKPVDKRTDIWAFGCVLYEMLTGRAAFTRETLSDTIAAILEREPDWRPFAQQTPWTIRRLLRRCLQKDWRLRLHDIADVRLELEETSSSPEDDLPAARSVPRRREWLAWASGAVGVVAAVAAIAWAWRVGRSTPLAPEMRLEITTPPTTDPVSFEISPDGRQFVFVATFEGRPRLWLRRLDAGSSRALPGTDYAAFPFWSPDGRAIGFFANQRLRRIDLDGNRVQALARVEVGLGGTWTRDGVILFSSTVGDSIRRVGETGGEAVSVTEVQPPQLGHRFPQILPDGRHFLYYVAGAPETSGVYVARLDGSDARRVISADPTGIHASPGHLLFVRQGTLYAQRFDPVTLALAGRPFLMAERVALESRFRRPALSSSATGPILYREAGPGGRQQLIWFDRTGQATGTSGEPADSDLSHPSLSPDGRYVAMARAVGGNSDVWLLDAIRGTLNRFTSDPATQIFPLWSPDGSRIVFGSPTRSIGCGPLREVDCWHPSQRAVRASQGRAEDCPRRRLVVRRALHSVQEHQCEGRLRSVGTAVATTRKAVSCGANGVRGGRRTILARREVDRLPVRRIGAFRGLRPAVSWTRRADADFDGWRDAGALEP